MSKALAAIDAHDGVGVRLARHLHEPFVSVRIVPLGHCRGDGDRVSTATVVVVCAAAPTVVWADSVVVAVVAGVACYGCQRHGADDQ